MAKKGQATQLQLEVQNDDDWERLLDKEGLIVVDIFSGWCGPCTAMTATLKKLKLELGGDNLQLAVLIVFKAKSDKIRCLERFRNKSEPTWMFISVTQPPPAPPQARQVIQPWFQNRKMVNLTFGANAPKLVKIITDELQNEQEVREGTGGRDEVMEVTDLAHEEKVRQDVANETTEEVLRAEREQKEQVEYDRMLAIAHRVLEHFPNHAPILVFPRAKREAKDLLQGHWEAAKLSLSTTERPIVTDQMIDEMMYFSPGLTFGEWERKELVTGCCLAFLLKPNEEEFEGADEVVLQIVYGSKKAPNGSEGSPADKAVYKMELPVQQQVQEEEGETCIDVAGIWAPPNALARAIAIKVLFPRIYDPIALPQQEQIPPHVLMAFDCFKRKEILDLGQQYSNSIMRYGFFTSDDPSNATLVAKTADKFEEYISNNSTYAEKLMVQVSKKYLEIYEEYRNFGPTFCSKNSVVGEAECRLFFPPDYDAPEAGELVVETKRRRRRVRKEKVVAAFQEAAAESTAVSEMGAVEEGGGGEEEEENVEEENVDEEEENEEGSIGADKATSPMMSPKLETRDD